MSHSIPSRAGQTTGQRGHGAAALLALLFAALALRTYGLGDAILILDEASSWRVATRSTGDVLLHCAANVHPPAHFFLLKCWIGLAGDSPCALRLLSAILGTLTVAAAYALVLEVTRLPERLVSLSASDHTTRATLARCNTSRFAAPVPAQIGALLAAALIAVCPLQVQIGRTARMYSLAVLLALVSCWLLLRARRAHSRRALWWSAYGLSVASLCYAHNYGLFTAAAQALFVLADCVAAAWRMSVAHAVQKAAPPAFAFSLALCLYSPWIAVLQSQAAEVRGGYWIGSLDGSTLQSLFSAWVTGVNYPPPWMVWPYTLALLATMAVVIVRRDAALWLLLVQAAVPWLAGIAFSLSTGESILQARYLAMSQSALFALLGAAMAKHKAATVGRARETNDRAALTGSPYRPPALSMVLAVLLAGPLLDRSIQSAAGISRTCDGIEAAVETIKRHRALDDLVLVSRPGEVNRMYYYLHRAGVEDLAVRCRHNPFGVTRHVPHLGSLTSDDLFIDAPDGLAYCWRLAATDEIAASAPANLKFQWEEAYGESARFSLSRYALGAAASRGKVGD
jgi:hypothetical protein